MVATAAVTTLVAPPAQAAAPTTTTPRLLSHSVTRALGGYITTMKYTNMQVRIYSSSGIASLKGAPKISTATMNGKVVHDGSGEVTIPGVSKTDMAAAVRAKAKTIPTDTAILHALGVSRADAAPMADLDRAPTSAGGASFHPLATAPASDPAPGELISADCADSVYDWNADIHNADGSRGGWMGHLHVCDNQYLVKNLGGGNWRLYDRYKASGSMHDFSTFNPDEVTGVLMGIHYSAYNYINDWSPDHSWTPNGCPSMSATLNVFGQSVTYTSTACSYSEGYYYGSNTYFETKWNGNGDGPSDGARSTWGHCDVQSPSNASATRGLLWHYWWE